MVPLISSPVLGLLIALGLMIVLLNVFVHANPRLLNDRFRRLQILSATYMALSHGSNDAQKTMGIMTLALVSAASLGAQTAAPAQPAAPAKASAEPRSRPTAVSSAPFPASRLRGQRRPM